MKKQKCHCKKFLILSILLIIADSYTKYLALQNLVPYQPLNIFPGLAFTLSFNTGVAFSLFDSYGEIGRWVLCIFSLVMSIIFVILLKQESERCTLKATAFSLILAGAIGNLLNRIFLGYVIDFIDVYCKNYHWPAFNIADSAITVGLVLWLISTLKKS